MGVLAQNHSLDGLTRPARINDSLCRLQQAPRQRCADPSPGPRRALDLAPALAPRPLAARWVSGGFGAERNVMGHQGTKRGRGGRGGGMGVREEALRESRRACGRPAAAPPPPELRTLSSPQGVPQVEWWPPLELAGQGLREIQTRARAGAWSAREPGAEPPG